MLLGSGPWWICSEIILIKSMINKQIITATSFSIALVRWFVPQLDSASKFHKGSSISKVFAHSDFETEALTLNQTKMIPQVGAQTAAANVKFL